MGIRQDTWIKRMAKEHRMIDPFSEHLVTKGKVSYGLSSYGYNITIDNKFKVFTNDNIAIVGPKNFDRRAFHDITSKVCVIPPQFLCFSEVGRIFQNSSEYHCALRW